ncbi:MAG: SurA N-terminal domain-containing protein [Vicinamibacterales bacterium]
MFNRSSRVPSASSLVMPLLLAALAGACGSSGGAATPAPSADAWAVVNGREITGAEVDKAYRRALQTTATPSQEELLTAKLQLLEDMIVQDLLIAKAQTLKIEVTPTEVDAAFNDAKKDIPDEAFQNELKSRQLTADEMREGVRKELIARKVIEQEITAKVNVSDQELSSFYEANKAQFNFPEDAIHLAQIVVTAGPDQQTANRAGNDATTPQEAAQKMQMLTERLKQGASFPDLARDFSEDPDSAPRGGDLGFVPVSRIRQAPPQLRDAVLKSEPGTIHTVNAGGVYQIVLVVAKEAAGQRDLNTPAVKDGITATLRGRKEQLLRTAFLQSLKNGATVMNLAAQKVVESPGALPSLMPKAPGTE